MDLLSLVVADIVAITVVVVAAATVDLWTPPRAVRDAARRIPMRPQRRAGQVPGAITVVRPIEQVAEHARRLHDRFHHPTEGQSYAKLEAVRRAYDQVLAEGCGHLGIEHLLGVLPPGEELDLERRRVEARLESGGLALSLTP